MNQTVSMPNHTINEVKCSLCHNYLSYFPILLTEDGEDVCGRCSIPKGKVGFHNEMFEKVAQHIMFPCKYKEQGCHKKLFPKDAPFHEENCHYRLVKCPGKEFISCSWEGARNGRLLHCQDSHKDVYLKDQAFELNLNNTSGRLEKFVEYNGALFIASISHDLLSNILSFMIYHINDSEEFINYSYQVVLSREKMNFIFESVTTSFVDRKISKISLDSLIQNGVKCETLTIYGNIAFEKSIDNGIITNKKLNERLLSLLICSICKNYALPPIRYQSGRMRCTDCLKIRADESKHDSAFNEVARILDYPCRYKKNGCDTVLNPEKMKIHLRVCQYRDIFCWICNSSPSSGKPDFRNHVLQEHHSIIVENGETISIENEETSVKHVIHYDNILFLIEFFIIKRNNDPFSRNEDQRKYIYFYKWCVYNMSSKVGYHYEIQIMKPNKNNVRLVMQAESYIKPPYRVPGAIFVKNNTVIRNIHQALCLDKQIAFKVTIFKK